MVKRYFKSVIDQYQWRVVLDTGTDIAVMTHDTQGKPCNQRLEWSGEQIASLIDVGWVEIIHADNGHDRPETVEDTW